MKVCHTVICFFFLSLQGHTGLSAQRMVFTGIVGGNVTFGCPPPSFSFNRKVFCKEDCKQEDILFNTTDVTAQNGRYRIQWTKGQTSFGNVSLTITQLTKSDSGGYRCGPFFGLPYYPIEIVVVDAQLDTSSEVKTLKTQTGGNITVQCSFLVSGSRRYFCKDGCNVEDDLIETTGGTAQRDRYSIRYLEGDLSGGGAFLHVTITQLTQSDSGRYRCGLDSTLSQQLEITVTDAPTTCKPNFTSSNTPTTTRDSTPEPPVTQSFGSGDSTSLNIPTTTRDAPMIVVGVVVSIVIISGLVLTTVCVKRNCKPDGMNIRGNSDTTKMELTLYENCPPVSAPEDSTYQSLDPASRDQDQTYSTLTHMQRP